MQVILTTILSDRIPISTLASRQIVRIRFVHGSCFSRRLSQHKEVDERWAPRRGYTSHNAFTGFLETASAKADPILFCSLSTPHENHRGGSNHREACRFGN